MSRSKSNDPADIFRGLISKMEKNVDSISQRLMVTDEFSRASNQLNELRMGMKDVVDGLTNRQLAAFNMPSRNDITDLGDRLHSIEARLTGIENQLTEIASAKTPGKAPSKVKKSGPPRTKTPPKKTAKKKAAKKKSAGKS